MPRWALFLLHSIFPLQLSANPPIGATIFFGANDAALPGRTSERQHVPIEEYKENLKKIVRHLKECSPSMLVVLITPPPVDEEGRMEYARSLYGEKAMTQPERTNEASGKYATLCVSLAGELGVPYVNLWSKMQEADGWQRKYLKMDPYSHPENIFMYPNSDLNEHCKALESQMDVYGALVDSKYLNDTHLRAYTLVNTLPFSGPLGKVRADYMTEYDNYKMHENHSHYYGPIYPPHLTYDVVLDRLRYLVYVCWADNHSINLGPEQFEHTNGSSDEEGESCMFLGEKESEACEVIEISDDDEEEEEEEEVDIMWTGPYDDDNDRLQPRQQRASDYEMEDDVIFVEQKYTPDPKPRKHKWARLGNRLRRVI